MVAFLTTENIIDYRACLSMVSRIIFITSLDCTNNYTENQINVVLPVELRPHGSNQCTSFHKYASGSYILSIDYTYTPILISYNIRRTRKTKDTYYNNTYAYHTHRYGFLLNAKYQKKKFT